jgi:hypothetical protein
MLRTIIRLALVALVVHAAVKTVPVFWHHVKFRDAVEEMAMFSAKRSENDVLERVMQIANRLDVPLQRENVKVRKQRNITFVDASYTAQLEYFPNRFYPWDFKVNVEGVPPRNSDILP